MPGWPTPHVRVTALVGALAALLAGGIALAGPATAAQDPAAPQATVLRGPSCDPGGIQIQVLAGTVGVDVRLATTRHPDGEDEAQIQPGARAVLTSDDVDWGETIDPRLEYTALDGSGRTFVDELDDWTMTRPSHADCAAIAAPPAAPSSGAGSPAAGSSGARSPGGQTSAGQSPAGQAGASQTPAGPAGSPGPHRTPAARTTAVVARGAAASDGAAARAVPAGGWITVRGSGFAPGEAITVHLRGRSAVLGRGMAGPDGTALVALRVPARASGPTQLDVVGASSRSTAGLRLLVAARQSAVAATDHPFSWPAFVALLSLVGAGGGVVVTGRRFQAGRTRSA